ncbi:MAG TPA: hypothetical protein VE621_00195, partial [Bryobacteraceae bacterium]|nr:hypothetical protein [Bryobacteraceae bacterium]
YGWQGDWIQKYWLWRDRKGLIGNPVGLLTTVFTVYGAMSFSASCLAASHTWALATATAPVRWLFGTTLILGLLQMLIRMLCVGRCYGVLFALFVPIRTAVANLINSAATLGAIHRYARARLKGEPLVWLKTEHAYPTQGALRARKRELGEVLVQEGYLTAEKWEMAVQTKSPHLRMERHLVRQGYLLEEDLYRALARRESLTCERLDPASIRPEIARALPASVAREWRVLPFKVAQGQLFLAAPEPPTDELHREIRKFTKLEIRFQLVTPGNYAQLATKLL